MATTIDSTPLIQPSEASLPALKESNHGIAPEPKILIFLKGIKRLGPFRLTCHLFGAVGLFVVASNISGGKDVPDYSAKFFNYGATLPLQFWLVIIGLCLSSLFYGLSNFWIQMFDILSTLRAKGKLGSNEEGLDYGRYLNSLPNAPVMNGLKSGFTGLVVARYLQIGLGIMLSTTYKLFLFTSPGFHEGAIDYHTIKWHLAPFIGEGVFSNNVRSRGEPRDSWEERQFAGGISALLLEGWAGGSPYGLSKAFVFPDPDLSSYLQSAGSEGNEHPDEGFVLVSIPDCYTNSAFEGNDTGQLRSVELVLVARKDVTPLTDHGSPSLLMPGNPRKSGFSKRTSFNPGSEAGRSTRWFSGSDELPLILEYSLPYLGKFEMSWAGYFEGWDCGQNLEVSCNDEDQPLLGYAVYNITYGIAHVVRQVRGSSCDAIHIEWIDPYKTSSVNSGDERLKHDSADGKGAKIIDIATSLPFGSSLPLSNLTIPQWTYQSIEDNLIYLMDLTIRKPYSSPLDALGMLAKFALLATAHQAAQSPAPVPLGPFNITTASIVGYSPNTTRLEEQFYAIITKEKKVVSVQW